MIKIKTSIAFVFSFICYFISSISFAFADESLDGECLTLSEYVSEGAGDNFLLMGAFRTVAKACSSVAQQSWSLFAPSLQEVIAIGAAIYVAVYTLKVIGSFSQQDTAGYLSNDRTGVIPVLAKAAVVIILLSDDGNTFLYGNIISPAVGSSMEVGSMLGNSGFGSSFSNASSVSGLFNNIIDKVKEFNSASYKIVAIGRNLICLTFLPSGILNKAWILLPFGTILYIFGWLICLGVAFSMLDVLFRIAVGCILLPFAIACGFSKLTSNYTKKTWELFVNACFNFILIGVVVCFAVKMLDNAVSANGDLSQTLESEIFEDKDEIAKFAQDLTLKGFLMTFLCSLIMFRFFSEIEQIVVKISGAKAVGNAGKNTATPFIRGAGKGAKKLATAPVKAATKTVGDSISDSGPVVAARTAINRTKRSAKANVKNFFGIKD